MPQIGQKSKSCGFGISSNDDSDEDNDNCPEEEPSHAVLKAQAKTVHRRWRKYCKKIQWAEYDPSLETRASEILQNRSKSIVSDIFAIYVCACGIQVMITVQYNKKMFVMYIQADNWLLVRDLFRVDLKRFFADAKLKDPERKKFGYIPFMAKTWLGRLMSESFAERMFSNANIVITPSNMCLNPIEMGL